MQTPLPPSPRSHGVRLQLLGPPRWRADGSERPLAPVDALLLALLALDGPQVRAQAAALLWPDSAPRQAALNLRQRLFRLKRAAAGALVLGDRVIALAPDVQHDLQDLEPGLAADPAHAPGELLTGVDVDDGRLGEWLQAARHRWRDARQRALAAMAEQHLAAGRIATALPYAERLVAEAPGAEHGHRRLMRLHYQRGDLASALAAYQRCCRWLADVLQTAPGPETVALAAQIEAAANAVAPPATTPAPAPLALLRPPRLIGREVALDAVAAARMAGHHLLFVGEPGIGKTRLLSELAARDGVDVVEARPDDAGQPYTVAARLVAAWHRRCGMPPVASAAREWAGLLPSLGEPAAGAADNARLGQALQHWAEHASACGVPAWIVDDLQFADAPSLALLTALAGADTRPQALLAVRAGEQPETLVAWLARDAGERMRTWLLEPWRPEEVADLLHDLPLPVQDPQAWAQALWRHAGGNPFHTLQTLLASDLRADRPPDALPVPRHLQAMVWQRLAQLDPAAQRLARLAAVAGGDFTVPLAAAVLKLHALDLAPAWQALEAAQFVDAQGFTHDLLREATRSTVPMAITEELHRQIARAGASLGMAPPRLAEHARRGGDWALALSAAEDSAAAAAARGLLAAQLQWLDHAADAAERMGDTAHRFALAHRACLLAHEVESAAEVERRLQSLAALASVPAEQLDTALARARWLGYRGDWPAMRDVAAEAHLAAAAHPTRQFEAACLLAGAMSQCGDHAGALACLMPWQATAAAHDDARLRHDWYSNFGYVLAAVNRRRASIEATERALAEAQALGELSQALTHAANLAGMWSQGGDLVAALDRARLAASLRDRLGQTQGLLASVADMNLGLILLRLGHYGEALERLQAALSAFEADTAAARWAQVARNHLASLWLGLGQTARAQALLARQPASQWRAVVLRARLPGQGRRAVLALREALDTARPLTERLALTIELAAYEDADAALVLAEQAEAEAEAGELDAYALAARLRRADALSRLGRNDEAVALAQGVEGALEAGSHPFDLSPADGAVLLSAIWTRTGHPDRAAAARARGRGWLRDEAAPRVPEPFRDAFVHRQPVHRALLAGGPPGDR